MAKQNPTVTVNVDATANENENEEEDDQRQQQESTKPPRLPRWTRQEILVLIQGKRVAENRVRRGRVAGMRVGSGQAVEPKWASVSAYCKRHGVNRGPVQCRKRWSNLSGDYKKIKEWESQTREEAESFWAMRNDLRRERRLPGFFDREVYDIIDGAGGVSAPPGLALALAAPPYAVEEEAEPVFDSGRSATEDGLFSDFEVEDGGGGGSPVVGSGTVVREVQPLKAASPGGVPILENQYQPTPPPCQDQGTGSEKQPAVNPEVGSASHEGRKRKRFAPDGDEDTISLQNQLVDVLAKNGKMLAAQLEAQNANFQLEREQRKDLAINLVAVLNKLADAIVKVADKL